TRSLPGQAQLPSTTGSEPSTTSNAATLSRTPSPPPVPSAPKIFAMPNSPKQSLQRLEELAGPVQDWLVPSPPNPADNAEGTDIKPRTASPGPTPKGSSSN
ncbi:hypothetical protein HDU81_010010, partial [Chytriomyces hyalinus]